MKIKIDSNKRKVIIVLTFMLFIIGIILLIKEYTVKQYINKDKIIYSFDANTYIDYNINIKNDVTYGRIIFPHKDTYISKYVDNIDLTFNNIFKGNDNVEINGKYSVIGKLIGFEGNEKEEKIIWSKDIIYVPTKYYRCNTNNKNIVENIVVDFSYYNELCKKLNKYTEVNTNQRLEITMNLEYTVIKDSEELDIKSNPIFVIPLSNSYFSLSRPQPINTTENIVIKEKTDVPLNTKKIIVLILLCIVSLLINIIMWLYTEEPTHEYKLIKKYIKLLKDYDKYLIAINDDTRYKNYTMEININSFDDLVKISDDIERPIMYVVKENLVEINEFFIADKSYRYVYKMSSDVLSKIE